MSTTILCTFTGWTLWFLLHLLHCSPQTNVCNFRHTCADDHAFNADPSSPLFPRSKPNVLICSGKIKHVVIFSDPSLCLNRTINFSSVCYGSIRLRGGAESWARRGVCRCLQRYGGFDNREEMSRLNKGPDLLLLCSFFNQSYCKHSFSQKIRPSPWDQQPLNSLHWAVI